MRPKALLGMNTIFAKDQSEYQQLPAFKTHDGVVVSAWELTDEEIEKLKETKTLFITMFTFNRPLQPLLPTVYLEQTLLHKPEQP